MGGEEDAVSGFGASVTGRGEEGLDAVDLAMEERGEALVVGLDRVRLEAGFGQDGGAEELGTGCDARTGERDDVGFGQRQEGGDEGFGRVCVRRVGGHSGMGTGGLTMGGRDGVCDSPRSECRVKKLS